MGVDEGNLQIIDVDMTTLDNCPVTIIVVVLNLFVYGTIQYSVCVCIFKKNLNASKPSEHPPSGEKMSEGFLGGNIGCRDKTSSWYQTGSPM